MKSKIPATPIALFPPYEALRTFELDDYPELQSLKNEVGETYFKQWEWAREFLLYIGKNKSEHTYLRFRNEVEKFLLWIVFSEQEPLDTFRKTQILDFADFCWQPPLQWITLSNHEKFSYHNGQWITNSKWKPFRVKSPKQHTASGVEQNDALRKRYRPSQETLTATFTAITAFYRFLINEEYCFANPAQMAKKDCRYFIKDVQVKEVRRLSENQWLYLLNTAHKLANQDSDYERNLFVVVALKVLFLRISELSERPQWSPTMNHFWQDQEGNWWLKIYGKGKKIRDITVPESFLDYLKRYRETRALPPLPSHDDFSPIVEKLRGRGGMSARHLARLVEYVMDQAYQTMKHEQGEDAARKLKEASTHWLRHTGASVEVERGRALKDLSEDLGHASMATTDTVYVQTENRLRAESGKRRKV